MFAKDYKICSNLSVAPNYHPMKTPNSLNPILFLALIAPLSAQNMATAVSSSEIVAKRGNLDSSQNTGFVVTAPLLSNRELPTWKKASGDGPIQKPVFAAQDASTLDMRLPTRRNVDAVIDLDLLREPSPFQEISKNSTSATSADREIPTEGLKNGLALISALYRESGRTETATDCSRISLSVEQSVKLDHARVLETVAAEVGANPSCACEIVKAAIKSSEADVATVVAIVSAAIHEAPETMRIVSQCAIAADPESFAEIQALLAKLDPNGGDSGTSAKSSKSGKDSKVAMEVPKQTVADQGNPLDFPGHGPIGPNPGTTGGNPLFPIIPPIIILPPSTSIVNP